MRTPEKVIRKGQTVPNKVVRVMSLGELCDEAGIACKVYGTLAMLPSIVLTEGVPMSRAVLCTGSDGLARYEINVNDLPIEDEEPRAIRVLEVLAYVFDHYGARESIRGYFRGRD